MRVSYFARLCCGEDDCFDLEVGFEAVPACAIVVQPANEGIDDVQLGSKVVLFRFVVVLWRFALIFQVGEVVRGGDGVDGGEDAAGVVDGFYGGMMRPRFVYQLFTKDFRTVIKVLAAKGGMVASQ